MYYKVVNKELDLILKEHRPKLKFSFAFFFLIMAFFTWSITSTLFKFAPLNYTPLIFVGIGVLLFVSKRFKRSNKKYPNRIRFSNTDQCIYLENSEVDSAKATINYSEIADTALNASCVHPDVIKIPIHNLSNFITNVC